ncbi:MAG: GNAT family N-acetyltransferase [Thermoplasmata archaeon]|nr:GNAT family N-acetyltransferase [Thermoplasmata archaeon]
MIRLEPMLAGEFDAALSDRIARNAANEVRRGTWTDARAHEASREEFNCVLPQGQKTPGAHDCKAVDDRTGPRVGEALYLVRTAGGKVQFWIDRLWIDPAHRRKGYASDLLRALEAEAGRLGADRVGLHVVSENEAARALYQKLGYRPVGRLRRKAVTAPPPS